MRLYDPVPVSWSGRRSLCSPKSGSIRLIGTLGRGRESPYVAQRPLHFDREEFPIPSDLYPFPFELEPLTKRSLGKYVLAEMPTEEVVKKLGLEKKIDEIRKYVGGAAFDTVKVHRRGSHLRPGEGIVPSGQLGNHDQG